MYQILNTVYSAIAAFAIGIAFDFVDPKSDYITVANFMILMALTNLKKVGISKVTKTIVIPAIILSAMIAQFWWGAWMHAGFVGSPNLLRPAIEHWSFIDGERSYDLEYAEMFFAALMATLLLMFLSYKIRRSTGKCDLNLTTARESY